MLRELIPGDLVKIQSSNDWKRSIIAAYNQDAGEILFQLNLNYFLNRNYDSLYSLSLSLYIVIYMYEPRRC